MSTVLVLTSSALGVASVSNQLVEDAVSLLRSRNPAVRVITRDLGTSPVPHLTADAAATLSGAEPTSESQVATKALADALTAELKAADTILVGAPMYNFGIPSTLKAWFDYVLRAGITFQYTENGAVGLLQDKRAIVIETRGGLYSEGAARAMDSQEPHLRTLLNFIGITDVTFVRAENLALGPEPRGQAIFGARAHLEEVVRDNRKRAA